MRAIIHIILFLVCTSPIIAECIISNLYFEPCGGNSVIFHVDVEDPIIDIIGATISNLNISPTGDGSYIDFLINDNSSFVEITITDPLTNISCSTFIDVYQYQCDYIENIEVIPPTNCAGDNGTLVIHTIDDVYVSLNGNPDLIFIPYPGDTITGLSEGNYTITQESGQGFSYFYDVEMPGAPMFEITSSSGEVLDTVLCGNASKVLSLPTAESYLWSTGETTQSITIEAAGTYSATITNPENYYCNETASINIVQNSPMYLSILLTNPNCFYDCTGSASYAVSGGTPPYTFQTTSCFSLCSQGVTYTVLNTDLDNLCSYYEHDLTVTDAMGCRIDTTYELIFDPACNKIISGHVGFKEDCVNPQDTICVGCRVNISQIDDSNIPNEVGFAFTNQEGNYEFQVDTGNYIIEVDTFQYNNTYELLCPTINEIQISINDDSEPFLNNDFFFEIPAGIDANLEMYSLSNPRPDEEFEIELTCHNLLNVTGTGTLAVDYDPTIADSVVYTNIPTESIDTESGLIQFDMSNLQIGELRTITIHFHTNPSLDIVDEQFCISAAIDIVDDQQAQNDSTAICLTVVNSFDPNIMTVHQLSNGNEFEGGDIYTTFSGREIDEVMYTVHFQNTGNAPAINIEVIDTLDAVNLDISSLQILASSHNYQASVIDNILTCTFPNIYLPDSTTNEMESQGYFNYKISLKPDITEDIKNKAAIYFDNNLPIITNEPILIQVFDYDDDGFAVEDDCDDTNEDINPNQLEETYNGIDDDCNPLTLDDDLDEDGFTLSEDCNDTNENINPNSVEIDGNNIDDDCDGITDFVTTLNSLTNIVVEIHPNPTTAILNIKSDKNVQHIEIFDLSGRRVKSSPIKNNQIDINDLQNGTYLLKIYIEDKIYHGQVVKI